jgi:hypothetical protein
MASARGLSEKMQKPETPVELLELAPELVAHDGFVTTLNERVAKFATVRSHVVRASAASRSTFTRSAAAGFGAHRRWRLSDLLAESATAGIPVESPSRSDCCAAVAGGRAL